MKIQKEEIHFKTIQCCYTYNRTLDILFKKLFYHFEKLNDMYYKLLYIINLMTIRYYNML